MRAESELRERRWSVLSARGREAERLTYDEAARLIAELTREGAHGLCIVTDEAARLASLAQKDYRAPAR